jgi:hypothetical protein
MGSGGVWLHPTPQITENCLISLVFEVSTSMAPGTPALFLYFGCVGASALMAPGQPHEDLK